MIFAREGLVQVAAHVGGEWEGHPLIQVRGVSIRLSAVRHLAVCAALADLGLGLITGHCYRGRPTGLGQWQLHDWRAIVRPEGVPREWRRDIVYVAAAPLLPLAERLHFLHRQRLAVRYANEHMD